MAVLAGVSLLCFLRAKGLGGAIETGGAGTRSQPLYLHVADRRTSPNHSLYFTLIEKDAIAAAVQPRPFPLF